MQTYLSNPAAPATLTYASRGNCKWRTTEFRTQRL